MSASAAKKPESKAGPVEEHEDSDDYGSGEDSEGEAEEHGGEEEEGDDEEEYGTAYLIADNPDAEEDDSEDGGWVPEGAVPEESDDSDDDGEGEDDPAHAPAPAPATTGEKNKKKRARESDVASQEDTTKKAKT
ncbi:hypothetical protein FRC07_014287 [Ceratobasidium sp. 392]|nr:hypothetical protein FRC07_014287 [Ceratobasidium sp. 392]